MFLLRLLRNGRHAFGVLATELFPFLGAGRARALPPMPTLIAVIAAGILIPLVIRVDARPGSMSSSLATQRLVRFQQEETPAIPALAPEGTLLCDQPAFRWPTVEGASRYGFRLYAISFDGEEALWIGSDVLRVPGYRLRSPARLEGGRGAGRAYRFEVRAYDAEGKLLQWESKTDRLDGAFLLNEMADEDLDALRDLRRDLPAHEAALVAAGLFAEKGTPFDVAASLEAYLDTSGGDEDRRALALETLKRLGWR